MTLEDIERGKISKLEKILVVWRRILLQKQNLYSILVLWLIFCLLLYRVPERIFTRVSAVNTTAVVEVLRDQIPVIEPAPSGDAIKRFEYVQSHVELYDGVAATPYEFNSRLRNDADIAQISTDLEHVMAEYGYYCLAATHIGHLKHIMRIGGRIYVNSKILVTDSEMIQSKEESAFYTGFEIVKDRAETIELEYFDDAGYKQTIIWGGMNSICAQHCLDTINGVRFALNDEL